MTPVKKKRLIFAIIAVLVCIGILFALYRPIMDIVAEPASLKEYVESYGPLGVLVFMLLNQLQVIIAMIPGGPFSIAAGYIWGPWLGTLICLISTSTISVVIFLLIRRFGRGLAEIFVSDKEEGQFKKLIKSPQAARLLLVIFLIPGTPKDPLTYLAGFTGITTLDWVLINLIGRFPGIFLSAVGGSSVEEGNLILTGVIFVIAVALYFVGKYIYDRHVAAKAEGRAEDEKAEKSEKEE